MCVRSWSLKLDFLCSRVHGNRYPEKGVCVFIFFSFVEHSGSCLVLKIPSKYLSNISLFNELCSKLSDLCALISNGLTGGLARYSLTLTEKVTPIEIPN